MWRATIKSLFARKVRLALTALAVILGVAFVAGTFVLTDTINHTFDNLFAEVNKGVAVQIQTRPAFGSNGARLPASLLQTVEHVPGVKLAVGNLIGYAQIVDKHGKAVTTGGAPTFGLNWVNAAGYSPLRIQQGRPPLTSSEVVIDAVTAKKYGFHVGDEVRVLFQGPPGTFTLVGITGFGSANNLGGATLAVFDTATTQRVLNAEGMFDSIAVASDPGITPTVLRDRIAAVLPRVMAGFTDSRTFRRHGVPCYGFVPMLLGPDEQGGMHGNNERLTVANVGFGLKYLYDVLRYVQ